MDTNLVKRENYLILHKFYLPQKATWLPIKTCVTKAEPEEVLVYSGKSKALESNDWDSYLEFAQMVL